MEKAQPKPTEPIPASVELDDAVIAKLPPNSTVLSVAPSRKSLWVLTRKIVVQLENGRTSQFFKKVAHNAHGANMMMGSFEAEQALYTFIPSHVPEPTAWGTYSDDPDTHFYLSEFVEMDDDPPKAHDWAAAVSTLHLESMGKSPTGNFGFHKTTHLANVPVNNTWNSSWAAFFAQQVKGLFNQHEQLHMPDEELAGLQAAYLEKTIPRSLGPLESEGRSIKPCLVHSDLWPGNIKPRSSSGELCIFDGCAYWGHNESDLAICRNPRYKLGQPCIDEYLERVPKSEPAADFDPRGAVYAIKYHTLLSIMYFKDPRLSRSWRMS